MLVSGAPAASVIIDSPLPNTLQSLPDTGSTAVSLFLSALPGLALQDAYGVDPPAAADEGGDGTDRWMNELLGVESAGSGGDSESGDGPAVDPLRLAYLDRMEQVCGGRLYWLLLCGIFLIGG